MSVSDELGKLGELHARGVLSDEEFARAKARILDGGAMPRVESSAGAINGLRRSASDKWLGGVCGGLAMSTGLASWVWRIIFVLCAIFAGSGVLAYVLLWIFVPLERLYLPAPNQAR